MGAALHRLPVEGPQPILQALNIALNIPRVQLGAHGRSLDGGVGDQRVLQHLPGALQAGLRLGLTQDSLTKQVEVELIALLLGLSKFRVERLTLGVKHQVAHHLAKSLPGQGHDERGEDRRSNGAHAHQTLVYGANKAGDGGFEWICQAGELVGCHLIIGGPGDPVHETHGESDTIIVTHQGGQLLRGGGFLLGCGIVGQSQPFLGPNDGGFGGFV